MTTKVAAELLKSFNDRTSTRPYGTGWLCTTPLTYSDGDAVRVLAEPLNEGFRVTDRAEAIDRLAVWGVVDSARAVAGIQAARQAAHLQPLASHPSETATFGAPADLGQMILDVAIASMRIEQLRWLAQDRPTMTYDERLVERVRSLASTHNWRWDRRPEIRLASGRNRRITAAVTGTRATAYIQAVSDADRDRSVEKCYYLFDRATQPRDQKVAALAGAPSEWPGALADDLATVGVVTFFEDPSHIERVLEEITGSAPRVHELH